MSNPEDDAAAGFDGVGGADRDDADLDATEHAEPVAIASFATEGEAEVAQAKLRAYGIDAALDDQIEGGMVAAAGEPGVIVEVRATDADDARRILSDEDAPLGDDDPTPVSDPQP